MGFPPRQYVSDDYLSRFTTQYFKTLFQKSQKSMRKPTPRRVFILLSITTCLGVIIFVYLEKKVHKQTDSKLENSVNIYSRMEYMDRDDPGEVPSSLEYSTDLFLEKVIQYKLQMPLKGQKINPVVQNVMEQLKRNGEMVKYVSIETINQFAKSRLQPRDTILSAADLKNIQNCKATSKQDYQKNYGAFFEGDQGRIQYIRRTHHVYLNSSSFMIEVGGNWGWDAGNFSKLYDMYYIILEPLTPYTDILEKNFFGNDKISVYNIGLGSENEVVMVNLEGNNACATTKFSKKNGTVPIYIVNAIDFLTNLGIGVYTLDLLTLDCEGCEFEVLETLIKSNLIEKIRNIQWATHTQISIADPWGRYCRIQELLKRTHHPTYQYKFNWESWRRNDASMQCIDQEE